MDPAHGMAHDHTPANGREVWLLAVAATLHCLTGCAIGEVLGMVIATAIGLGNAASIVLSIVLAFTFGYGLTIRPLLAVMSLGRATRLALGRVPPGRYRVVMVLPSGRHVRATRAATVLR